MGERKIHSNLPMTHPHLPARLALDPCVLCTLADVPFDMPQTTSAGLTSPHLHQHLLPVVLIISILVGGSGLS
jgi:hypothetical protein